MIDAAAERLADSLLYEGYALYPYTPGATKNATPTPFGIVYPPAYAARRDTTYDHLQIECVALAPGAAELEVAVVFLQAAGSRHRAAQQRIEAHAGLEALTHESVEQPFVFEAGPELGVSTGEPRPGEPLVLSGRLLLTAERLELSGAAGGQAWKVAVRVENTTPLPDPEVAPMDRAGALCRSLLSTHVLAGLDAGQFASPLENAGPVGAAVRECENVNSWPVLAAADDTAVLGAAILLPDHPQIAAQSKVNMFDNTEIDEALTLHVQSLTDAERAEIAAAGDPVVERDDRAG